MGLTILWARGAREKIQANEHDAPAADWAEGISLLGILRLLTGTGVRKRLLIICAALPIGLILLSSGPPVAGNSPSLPLPAGQHATAGGPWAAHPSPQQEDPDDRPLVWIADANPSTVNPGQRIRVTVEIAPPLEPGTPDEDRIEGGIIVFDNWQGAFAAELIAFVFRGGQATRSMSYVVLSADDSEDVEPSTEPGSPKRTQDTSPKAPSAGSNASASTWTIS